MHNQNKTIAIFAHPGHELRCFGFLQHLSAKIIYLSDASASTGRSRLAQSTSLLRAHGLGIITDALAIPDADIYAAILAQDSLWLSKIYNVLCDLLAAAQPSLIVTDAPEGYNPVHDLCHFLTVFAARKAVPLAKIMVTPLTDHPHELDGVDIGDCMVLDLDTVQETAKVSAMATYAKDAGGQLADEAKAMEAKFGPSVHSREILLPTMNLPSYFAKYSTQKPHFENYGEQRVQNNKYQQILRLHPHLAFALNFLSKLPGCEF